MNLRNLLTILFLAIISGEVIALDCTNGYVIPSVAGTTATQDCIDAGYPGCQFFCCANCNPVPALCVTSCSNIAGGQLICCMPPVEETVNEVLCNIVIVLWGITAAVTTLVIVMAGIKWMGAMEDAAARAQAKTTIIHAIVGLVIVVLTMSIINWLFVGAGTFSIYQFDCSP